MVVKTPPPVVDFLRDQSMERLRMVARLRASAHCVVQRARMVLTYFEGASLRETARQYRAGVSTVRRWVGPWCAKRTIDALSDRPRSGRRPRFGMRETSRVLSIVCQAPKAYGIHDAGWTQERIREVLAAEGTIVSRSTVQRILARQDINIRTVKYWLHTPRDRPEFVARRNAICDLYLKMNSLPTDEIVVCFDPKPGIQILGDPKRWGGSSGSRPGKPKRAEFEYRRLGTRSLVAAVRPDTGEVVHFDLYHKERRFDSAETIAFLEALRQELQSQGYRRIHLVLDNGSTHRSKATTAYFEKNSDTFETYFTPVHASWLNLCENFFSTFSRRYLRHRRYGSVGEFVEGVPSWIDDHNQRCNPLNWTYAPHQRAA
jgi:transposase